MTLNLGIRFPWRSVSELESADVEDYWVLRAEIRIRFVVNVFPGGTGTPSIQGHKSLSFLMASSSKANALGREDVSAVIFA